MTATMQAPVMTQFEQAVGSGAPVIAMRPGGSLSLDGRRLGLLGDTMLQVNCSCGRSG